MPLEHLLAMYYKKDDNTQHTEHTEEKQPTGRDEMQIDQNTTVASNRDVAPHTQDEDNPFLNQRVTRGCWCSLFSLLAFF